MKKISFIFLILFLIQHSAFADDMVIVDVHRNITLSDDEPVYKDFAISTGESSGLKKNLVVNVMRKLSIKDSSSKSIADIETVVGQLKIIQVEKKIAIAREYKLIPRDEEMVLDQIGIMTGDRIDLKDSFVDSKPISYKKKEREPSSQKTAQSDALDRVENNEKNSGEGMAMPAHPLIRLNPQPTPEI